MIYNVHTESALNKINDQVQKLNEAIKFIDIDSIKSQFGDKVICTVDMNGSIGTRPSLEIKFDIYNFRFYFRYNFANKKNKKNKLYLSGFYCPYLYNKTVGSPNFSEFKKNITREDMLYLVDCFKDIKTTSDYEMANKKILSYNKTKQFEKDFK